MAYVGGVDTYRAICDQVAATGYAGFRTYEAQQQKQALSA